MNLCLAPAITPISRLQTALDQLIARHDFSLLDETQAETFCPPGKLIVLFTDDPQRSPEVLDACVILPEALKSLGRDDLVAWVADSTTSAFLMRRFGIKRAPAVVFLLDGALQGHLDGIRDWHEYRRAVDQLLTGENPPPIFPISVIDPPRGDVE